MGLAALERVHDGGFFVRFHLAVKQAHFELGENLGLKPLRLRDGGLELGKTFGFALIDEWVNEVRLVACAQLLANTVIRFSFLGFFANDLRDDGSAARRKLCDAADREIAVGGERKRPRDRGRGEDQCVRQRHFARDRIFTHALVAKRAPLIDAEPMLLIHHVVDEIGEGDCVLQQRVGSDQSSGSPDARRA